MDDTLSQGEGEGTLPLGGSKGTLALFPGMAAAFPGMGRPLIALEGAEATYAAFARASGVDVAALACTANEEDLFRDRSWELAVVATEAAALNAWLASGRGAAASLGFSIGVYAALLAAGAIDIEQVVGMIDVVLEACLKLHGRFSMLAVFGAPLEKVLRLCRLGHTELAAVMQPSQFLIAGREEAVQALAGAVDSLALKVTTLSVRWPLHTSLMRPVAEVLGRSRAGLGRLRPLCLPVYSALHGGRIETPEEGWRLLVENLFCPQRFDLAFEAARRAGLRHCVEFGPGGTLERTVRWLGRDRIEVEAFPAVAQDRRRGVAWR
jgi:[acyl-carrier-protein] S-malonyltransferase